MASDKELYNRYQNEIMDYELFKSMTDKRLKTLLFRGWISKFGGKQIRDTMNIPYSTWDYNNRTFGTAAKGNNPEIEPEEEQSRNFIEAEFTVVPNKNVTRKDAGLAGGPLAIPNQEQAQQPEKKSFVSVEWTNDPDVIKSQMEALAAMLKFERSEITVKIEVFK